MKLSDFHILYINLDRRPERRNNIELQFSKLNLLNNVTRISAIDGQLIDQNINELAEEVFKMPTKTGRPDSINGIIDIINNPRYSTVIGIVKYVFSNDKTIYEPLENDISKDLVEKIKIKITNIIKIFK